LFPFGDIALALLAAVTRHIGALCDLAASLSSTLAVQAAWQSA
jgi:hypothetical protein